MSDSHVHRLKPRIPSKIRLAQKLSNLCRSSPYCQERSACVKCRLRRSNMDRQCRSLSDARESIRKIDWQCVYACLSTQTYSFEVSRLVVLDDPHPLQSTCWSATPRGSFCLAKSESEVKRNDIQVH